MAKKSNPDKRPTAKQAKFVQNVVSGMTMLDAYWEAYGWPKGHKYNQTAVSAHRIMQLPHIRRYHKELIRKAENNAVMDRNEALQALTKIARAQLKNYMRPDGSVDLAAIQGSAQDLQKLKVTKRETHHESGSVTYTEEVTVGLRCPIKSIERMAKMQDWDLDKDVNLGSVTFKLDTGVEDELDDDELDENDIEDFEDDETEE